MVIMIVGWFGTQDSYRNAIEAVEEAMNTLCSSGVEDLAVITCDDGHIVGATAIRVLNEHGVKHSNIYNFCADKSVINDEYSIPVGMSSHFDYVYAFGSKAADKYKLDNCGIKVIYFNVEGR